MPGADPAPGSTPAERRVDWAYLIAAVSLVVAAVGIVEFEYSLVIVPPGVDPGDWIQRSYAFVGLPYPPVQAIGSPFVYPPVIFPPLGALELATGSPLTTGFLFGGIILAAFGLASIALGWKALGEGPFRLAFVALSVLNGTLLSMLFWGAYPNFVGFALFDVTIACAIGFVRTEGRAAAFGIWAGAALTYLTHSLTFYLLLGTIFLLWVLLVSTGRFRLAWLRNRGHQAGIAVLVGSVAAYEILSRVYGIAHPDYFFSNPAAFTLDNLGELFTPLSVAPAILPAGASVYLPPREVLAILGLGGLGAMIVPWGIHRVRPKWADASVLVTGSWLAAVLLLPAVGYLAHIDTDYTRFLYFLPQPLALAGVLALERSVGTRGRFPVSGPTGGTALRGRRAGLVGPIALHGALAIGVVLLVVNVSIPVAQANELDFTGLAHDAAFLDAAKFLSSSPTPGSVLTVQGAARWTEALTGRGAYDIGPTWLLFENWQVTNAEMTYWALNSYVALTDGSEVLSYSNLSGPVLNQAPMYTVYVDGVAVPVLRCLPGASSVTVHAGGATQSFSLTQLGTPVLSWTTQPSVRATTVYSSPLVQVVQTSALGPGGTAWVNYTMTPAANATVPSAEIALAPAPSNVPTMHLGGFPAANFSGAGFSWSQGVSLGQYPSTVLVPTTGEFASAPSDVVANATGLPGTVDLNFANPAPPQPLHIAMRLSTGGTSNAAASLPNVMYTPTFLSGHRIHFLLVPATGGYAQTVTFYELTFGYRVVYQNPEWQILQD